MNNIGKVIEVFIPNNNEDIMYSTKIGFIVKLNDKTINIIEEQNKINSSILKDDKVLIIDNKIHKYNEE